MTAEESDGQVLARLGTDAQLWAREFMRVTGHEGVHIDEGLMLTWFANAIEVGRSAGQVRRVESCPNGCGGGRS